MHKMGLVGVWLVVVAALASTILTSRLIQVRDSWTKKLVGYQKQLATTRPKIADLTEELSLLEAERFRARELWGDYWKDVPTAVQPGGMGTVVANIGIAVQAANARDVVVHDKQTLYGFEMLPDGKVAYRGDFTVLTARDQQSQLQPNWGVRPEDVQTWQPEAKWRWRVLIPPTYQPNFDLQILAINKADDVLTDRKKILDNEIKLEAQARDQLKLREAELVGGPQLSKDPGIGEEYRAGYIAAIEQVEEARNSVLLKVDELRHRLRAVQHEVDRIKQGNLELAKRLAQPAAPAVSSSN